MMAYLAVCTPISHTRCDLQHGDVGAILGLGFPPFRGGPFRFLDGLGAEKAVTRMNELALTHGSRFLTPAVRLVPSHGVLLM